MSAFREWQNKKDPKDTTTVKVLKGVARTGQYMVDNPSSIVGTQAAIVATGVTAAKLSSPKPKKMGLTAPNQKNIGKVLNRLNRMSIPYDSYTLSGGAKYKTGSRLDQVLGNKKLNVNKSQNLYESSNKGSQNRRLTRLMSYKAEQTIGTNKGYKHGYSGKKDFNKSDIVKDIKKYRTMGKIIKGIKSITVPGIIGLIMKPKPVADATLYKVKDYKRN